MAKVCKLLRLVSAFFVWCAGVQEVSHRRSRCGHNVGYVCDPSDDRSALRLALAQAISLTDSYAPSAGA